jgi:hypothetical protein
MRGKIALPLDARRGERMSKGKGWRLVNQKKSRAFKARLVTTMKEGQVRLAVFRVYDK